MDLRFLRCESPSRSPFRIFMTSVSAPLVLLFHNLCSGALQGGLSASMGFGRTRARRWVIAPVPTCESRLPWPRPSAQSPPAHSHYPLTVHHESAVGCSLAPSPSGPARALAPRRRIVGGFQPGKPTPVSVLAPARTLLRSPITQIALGSSRTPLLQARLGHSCETTK